MNESEIRFPRPCLGVSSLTLLAILFSVQTAHAYDLKSHTWSSDPTMKVATISFPSGSVWRDDLENGVGRWNGMWGMWLEFNLSYSNYSSFSNGDGDNNLAFVSSADIGGAWGLTWSRYSGSTRTESDITFNAEISWYTGAQDERVRNTDKPAFRKVVVHEFGHCVGLNHYCSELAQMAQGSTGHVWYGGCEKYRHHPTADDCEGARALYPYPANSEEDATLMNFEMSGSCGSQIWRRNTANTVIDTGGTIDVEYTVCNVGNVGISFDLGIYLSTNDYISKYDTYIDGFSYYLSDHTDWERDKTFTVPGTVSSGTYYVGALVDIDNDLSEARECNNRLVFPGTWTVP